MKKQPDAHRFVSYLLSPHYQNFKEGHIQTKATPLKATQKNEVSSKANREIKLLAADWRHIYGTAHSCVTDHSPTYVYKNTKTLKGKKEEKKIKSCYTKLNRT